MSRSGISETTAARSSNEHQRGERLTITRAGKPVAQLVALARPPVPLDELAQRSARLPEVDPAMLRQDIDAVIDASL